MHWNAGPAAATAVAEAAPSRPQGLGRRRLPRTRACGLTSRHRRSVMPFRPRSSWPTRPVPRSWRCCAVDPIACARCRPRSTSVRTTLHAPRPPSRGRPGPRGRFGADARRVYYERDEEACAAALARSTISSAGPMTALPLRAAGGPSAAAARRRRGHGCLDRRLAGGGAAGGLVASISSDSSTARTSARRSRSSCSTCPRCCCSCSASSRS